MTNQFDHARAKLRWAVRHIEGIQKLLGIATHDSNAYRIFTEVQPDGGDAICVDFTGPLDPAFGLCIGDAVHNLRASLDYVVSDIARRDGWDGARIHFPFDETRERLEKSVAYRKIEATHPDVASLILDTIQPYETGAGDALWRLNKLDNIDKHRLLIPVIQAGGLSGVCAKSDSGTIFHQCTMGVIGNGRFRAVAVPGRIEITDYGKPTFRVLFGQGQFFETESIIPTLQGIAELISGTIEALELRYFGSA